MVCLRDVEGEGTNFSLDTDWPVSESAGQCSLRCNPQTESITPINNSTSPINRSTTPELFPVDLHQQNSEPCAAERGERGEGSSDPGWW